MPRGKPSTDGDTRVAKNGYSYTKENGVWRLTHHILAETKLGRKLRVDERVEFKDGNRRHLVVTNIVITIRGTASERTQLARIEARIDELTAQRDELRAKLEKVKVKVG